MVPCVPSSAVKPAKPAKPAASRYDCGSKDWFVRHHLSEKNEEVYTAVMTALDVKEDTFTIDIKNDKGERNLIRGRCSQCLNCSRLIVRKVIRRGTGFQCKNCYMYRSPGLAKAGNLQQARNEDELAIPITMSTSPSAYSQSTVEFRKEDMASARESRQFQVDGFAGSFASLHSPLENFHNTGDAAYPSNSVTNNTAFCDSYDMQGKSNMLLSSRTHQFA